MAYCRKRFGYQGDMNTCHIQSLDSRTVVEYDAPRTEYTFTTIELSETQPEFGERTKRPVT